MDVFFEQSYCNLCLKMNFIILVIYLFKGKTYTVLSDDGLIPQTIEKLLNNIAKCTEFSYRVTFSYLQIYQDRIYDLLFSNQAGALILREHPQEGMYDVIVLGLSRFYFFQRQTFLVNLSAPSFFSLKFKSLYHLMLICG